MRFINFDLESPNDAIALHAMGFTWDLHNFAEFEGLRVDPDSSVVLTWTVPDVPNPWGDRGNQFGGCALRFRELRELHVTLQDPNFMPSEEVTLADVSKVTPGPGEYRQRLDWRPQAPFHLLFRFHSGLSIEIAAAEAELQPLAREAAA